MEGDDLRHVAFSALIFRNGVRYAWVTRGSSPQLILARITTYDSAIAD
jgi:hypothetical protein